jgi:hypothetical protein
MNGIVQLLLLSHRVLFRAYLLPTGLSSTWSI